MLEDDIGRLSLRRESAGDRVVAMEWPPHGDAEGVEKVSVAEEH